MPFSDAKGKTKTLRTHDHWIIKEERVVKPQRFIDPQGTTGLEKGSSPLAATSDLTESRGSRSCRTRASSSSPPPHPEIGLHSLLCVHLCLPVPTRQTYQCGTPEAFMANPQSDSGEFLLGPCGEKQEVVEAGWAGLTLENLVQSGPQVSHSAGQEVFTQSTALAGPLGRQPQSPNPVMLL